MNKRASFGVAGVAGAVVALFSNSAAATTDPTETRNSTQAITSVLAPITAGQTASLIGSSIGGAIGGGAGGGFVGASVNRFGLTGQAAAAGAPKLNGWLAFSQSKVGYTPLGASGTVNVAVVGLDYSFSNTVVAGVALSGDRTRVNTDVNGGSLNGNGYTLSPYVGVALNREFSLDATVGFGRTKNDINAGVGAGSGSFTDRRTMASVGVTYRRDASGPWLLSGRGALLTVSDKLGAYTLSNGGLVSDGTVNVTQMRLSGQLGYKAGMVTPYVGLTYIYDISRPTIQAIPGGQTPSNDRDAWTPSIGLRFNSAGSLYGGVQYSSEQSRSQVKNNQFLFNLGIRF